MKNEYRYFWKDVYRNSLAGMALNEISGELYRKILCACDRVPEYRLVYAGSYNNEVVAGMIKRTSDDGYTGEISTELVEEVLGWGMFLVH